LRPAAEIEALAFDTLRDRLAGRAELRAGNKSAETGVESWRTSEPERGSLRMDK
jgi:hypothetical protein